MLDFIKLLYQFTKAFCDVFQLLCIPHIFLETFPTLFQKLAFNYQAMSS